MTPAEAVVQVEGITAAAPGAGMVPPAMGPSTDAHAFGVQVAAARKAKGLSQRGLAKACGVAAGTIGNIETGRMAAGPSIRAALAKALGLDG
jgi:DNA-binding XRE family transcriptional regulator